jgi:hypothetical protein
VQPLYFSEHHAGERDLLQMRGSLNFSGKYVVFLSLNTVASITDNNEEYKKRGSSE